MTDRRTENRYRLDSRIATGGMGEVWRATDTVLDRRVAVKILKAEYADDPMFRSRFEAEARNAAALHHHNVASVFDFGELPPDDGSGAPRPYLVMELVPGEPLSGLLRNGEPMPADQAARLVAQAADGVAAAHALGIVHRDVKPGNLLVSPQGRVKVTDFGIARAGDGAALTQTGQVVGTPAYLSPEQAEGKSATTASDIYALGVVLYECLAGARPFARDSAVSTALAHLREEPPALPDTVPPHLREVVATALAKDPAHRFASMSAFATALRGGPIVLPDDDQSTRVMHPVAPRDDGVEARRRGAAWLPWAAAAAGLLLIVLLVSWAADDLEEPAPTAVESSAPADPTTTSSPAGVRVRAGDYVGLPYDEARARLTDRGLEVARTIVANPGGERPGVVSSVRPTGVLKPGTTVTLAMWGPRPEADPDDSEEKDDKDESEPEKKGPSGKDDKGKGKKKGRQ